MHTAHTLVVLEISGFASERNSGRSQGIRPPPPHTKGRSSHLLLLRARPKAERVFAEDKNFLNLSDPTDQDRPDPTGPDRDAFQRLISFEPSYRLENGFRHLKATFNKSFALA